MKRHQTSLRRTARPFRTPVACCLLALVLAAGCSHTKEARGRLAQAQALYETGQFAAAKNAVDTLRALFPRELDVMRDALTLMRLVERGESVRNVAYCDSLAPLRLEEAERLKKGFVFEKEEEYEETGRYVRQEMTVERNVERSHVRCGVDEKGEIYLASVYFGASSLRHTGLALSIPDGSGARTATIPYDGGMNYRFTDGGNETEVVTYRGENGIAAIRFIYDADRRARIRAEYTGGRPFALYLSS
ncbi:MAG: hypothetical protein LBK07_00020, partial [Tannerella sp.]|nr:hypothetical protein [Tannerella sp.]